MTFCVSNQQELLYNHSQLHDLTLKNLALYPSNFSTSASSDTTIYWANVNFQEFGFANQRVWQFNVSGITNQNTTMITFIIATRYNIRFEGSLSGWLTTSSNENAINANDDLIEISYSNEPNKTIFTIYIRQDEPLQTFSFNVFQRDNYCAAICGETIYFSFSCPATTGCCKCCSDESCVNSCVSTSCTGASGVM
jgi:hypothetical protein